MNQPFDTRNRLAKIIVLKASDLLEHFQWGKQSVSDERILETIVDLENAITDLKKQFRD